MGVVLGQLDVGRGAGAAQIDVVGHGEVLEHLLRHLGEDRRGDGCAVVRSLGRVENHGHGDHRVVDRGEAGKRSDVHGLRVEMRGRIDFLRRAGLAAGGVAVELSRSAGTVEHHAFHHLAHFGGGHRGEDTMRSGRQRIGQLTARLERRWRRGRCFAVCRSIHLPRQQHARGQIDAAVGDRRNHRDQLQRRDADLLSNGDGANRR